MTLYFVDPLKTVFMYNGAITCTSVLRNLTFPDYEFGKRQYDFYPKKLPCFGEKNKAYQK